MAKNLNGIKKLFQSDTEFLDDEDIEIDEITGLEVASEDAVTPRSSARKVNRITNVEPQNYNDAPLIGDPYRNGVPVIMNLSNVETKDAKRFIDFASGLTYGLNGHLEKVTDSVFLLSPRNVEITSNSDLSDTGDFFSTE